MAKTTLLKEDVSNKYELLPEDIITYAKQIGIDVKNEKDLLWIAEQGLSASVPKPWIILADDKDRIFYYNTETNESSWFHPLDKEYSALVIEERTKSKSLNSASSDFGFESKLSSLADAPPLSSSEKHTKLSSKHGRTDTEIGHKKMDVGRFKNRRGTQLTPVRLNSLKMPVPSASPKSGTGMSFMPKGSSLTRNIRRVKDPIHTESQTTEDKSKTIPSDDNLNESLNSDDDSKYSYEESEDEGHSHGADLYDPLKTSRLSPAHSTDESPDAMDINSLVQLNTKVSQRLSVPTKLESLSSKENSPSLSLRKVGQPSVLKPLQQKSKKKNQSKNTKNTKKESSDKNNTSIFLKEDEKISASDKEQKLMIETIQNEWAAMQKDIEREEKTKYENMINESSKKLEEEELRLREENSEKIAALKNKLQRKVEEEKEACEKHLEEIKESNQARILEEEIKHKKELETMVQSFKSEIESIEGKNNNEIKKKKEELEKILEEIEKNKTCHENTLKNMQEAYAAELDILEKVHKQKTAELQEVGIEKIERNDSNGEENLQRNFEELEKKMKEEEGKYEKILKDIESKKIELKNKQENLTQIKEETNIAQKNYDEMQDEIEKVETDLDLLRNEKSALILELNILKENINNEKSNMKNLNHVPEKFELKHFVERGVNTFSTYQYSLCKSSQTEVSSMNAASQVEDLVLLKCSYCQTSEIESFTENKYCQVDLVARTDCNSSIPITTTENKTENLNVDRVVNKAVENVLNGLSMKMDGRIQVIEDQLKLLQEKLTSSVNHQSASNTYSDENAILTGTKLLRNTGNGIGHVNNINNSTVASNCSGMNPSASSHIKCMCENGDPSSCEVMQDVKNSIYRLNDVLSHNFVPSINNNVFEYSRPIAQFSNPIEHFYSEFRELQERHRLIDLKHKCEINAAVQVKNHPSNITNINNPSSFKDNSRSSHQFAKTSFHLHNALEDPLLRARNLILREQAKSWRQQQQLFRNMLPAPQIIPSGIDVQSSKYLSSSAVIPETFNRVSLPQHRYSFESDSETEYNTWMSRLDALQQKIRSHKLF